MWPPILILAWMWEEPTQTSARSSEDRIARGKALTTYDDFSRGVLDALGVAAHEHGVSVRELLERTSLFVNGTTVVTKRA